MDDDDFPPPPDDEDFDNDVPPPPSDDDEYPPPPDDDFPDDDLSNDVFRESEIPPPPPDDEFDAEMEDFPDPEEEIPLPDDDFDPEEPIDEDPLDDDFDFDPNAREYNVSQDEDPSDIDPTSPVSSSVTGSNNPFIRPPAPPAPPKTFQNQARSSVAFNSTFLSKDDDSDIDMLSMGLSTGLPKAPTSVENVVKPSTVENGPSKSISSLFNAPLMNEDADSPSPVGPNSNTSLRSSISMPPRPPPPPLASKATNDSTNSTRNSMISNIPNKRPSFIFDNNDDNFDSVLAGNSVGAVPFQDLSGGDDSPPPSPPSPPSSNVSMASNHPKKQVPFSFPSDGFSDDSDSIPSAPPSDIGTPRSTISATPSLSNVNGSNSMPNNIDGRKAMRSQSVIMKTRNSLSFSPEALQAIADQARDDGFIDMLGKFEGDAYEKVFVWASASQGVLRVRVETGEEAAFDLFDPHVFVYEDPTDDLTWVLEYQGQVLLFQAKHHRYLTAIFTSMPQRVFEAPVDESQLSLEALTASLGGIQPPSSAITTNNSSNLNQKKEVTIDPNYVFPEDDEDPSSTSKEATKATASGSRHVKGTSVEDLLEGREWGLAALTHPVPAMMSMEAKYDSLNPESNSSSNSMGYSNASTGNYRGVFRASQKSADELEQLLFKGRSGGGNNGLEVPDASYGGRNEEQASRESRRALRSQERRKELIDTHMKKPLYSIRRVKMLCHWINSLHIWPEKLEILNLHREFCNGLLLARLMKVLLPSATFLHLHERPFTQKAAIDNLEQVLGIIWRSKSVNNSRIPTAQEILTGKTAKLIILLQELYDVYIRKPLYTRAVRILKWYNNILKQYSRGLPEEVFAEGDLGDVWSSFQSGVSLFCVFYHLFGSGGIPPTSVSNVKLILDPLRIFEHPRSLREFRANIFYVFSIIQHLGIENLWEAEDWITYPDTEFVLMLLQSIYEKLQDRQCSLPPAQRGKAGITSGPNGQPQVVGMSFADSVVSEMCSWSLKTSRGVLMGTGEDSLPWLPIEQTCKRRQFPRFFPNSSPAGLLSQTLTIDGKKMGLPTSTTTTSSSSPTTTGALTAAAATTLMPSTSLSTPFSVGTKKVAYSSSRVSIPMGVPRRSAATTATLAATGKGSSKEPQHGLRNVKGNISVQQAGNGNINGNINGNAPAVSLNPNNSTSNAMPKWTNSCSVSNIPESRQDEGVLMVLRSHYSKLMDARRKQLLKQIDKLKRPSTSKITTSMVSQGPSDKNSDAFASWIDSSQHETATVEGPGADKTNLLRPEQAQELANLMESLEEDMIQSQREMESLEEDLASRYLELEGQHELLEGESYRDSLESLELERERLEEEKLRLQEHFELRLQSIKGRQEEMLEQLAKTKDKKKRHHHSHALSSADWNEEMKENNMEARSKRSDGNDYHPDQDDDDDDIEDEEEENGKTLTRYNLDVRNPLGDRQSRPTTLSHPTSLASTLLKYSSSGKNHGNGSGNGNANANANGYQPDESPVVSSSNKEETRKQRAEKGWIGLCSKMETWNFHINKLQSQSSKALQDTWTPPKYKASSKSSQHGGGLPTTMGTSDVNGATHSMVMKGRGSTGPDHSNASSALIGGPLASTTAMLHGGHHGALIGLSDDPMVASFQKFQFKLREVTQKWYESKQHPKKEAVVASTDMPAPTTKVVPAIGPPMTTSSSTAAILSSGTSMVPMMTSTSATNLDGSMNNPIITSSIQPSISANIMDNQSNGSQSQSQYQDHFWNSNEPDIVAIIRQEENDYMEYEDQRRQLWYEQHPLWEQEMIVQPSNSLNKVHTNDDNKSMTSFTSSNRFSERPYAIEVQAAMNWLTSSRPLILMDRKSKEYLWSLLTIEDTSNTRTGGSQSSIPLKFIYLWKEMSGISPNESVENSDIAIVGQIGLEDVQKVEISSNDSSLVNVLLKDIPRALKNSGGRVIVPIKCRSSSECAKLQDALSCLVRAAHLGIATQ